jgi:hypothetical protein
VGVGGVLADRQVGLVAEQLVQRVVALAVGRHDLLRPVRRPLVGDVRVGRQDASSIDDHVAAGEGLTADGEPLPVRGRHGAAAELLGQLQPVVVVDDHGVGVAERVLPHVPFLGPGQGVVGDAARLGHAGEPEVGGSGDEDREDVALEFH